MTDLVAYPDYRAVGTPWIGKVPAGWSTSRLRYLCDISTGSGDTIDAALDGPYPFIVRSPHALRATTYDHDCEAILTVGDGAVGEVFHHLTGKFLAHQRVYVLSNFRDIDSRFLFHYFSSLFRHMARDGSARTTVDSVRRWMLTDMPIALPPRSEQRAIVDFVDHQTGRIDELIAEQQRLTRILGERRAAVVDQIVWRGLAEVPMAETGVEPVGQAPAHWRRLRNKNLLVESQDLSDDGTEELLSVSHITGVTPRADKTVTMMESESLGGYRLVRVGDLVINTMWAWMGALGMSRIDGIVSPAYGVYTPVAGAEFDPTYFDYLYRSRPYVVEMTRHSRGIWSSRLRIYPEVFLRLPIVVPPLAEQRSIAAHLDEQTSKIDKVIAETERLIELARERRSALITAAVTGQIDVREVA